MPDVPVIVQYQQGNDVSPAPEGYTQVTNPLNPIRSSASRLSHFDRDVYDLSPESHLSRLLKAFLGDSGVGIVQKQMLLVRLQQALSGTRYFDLDAFYGALFGSGRRNEEVLPHDPYSQALSIEEWDEMNIRDGAYKSRVSRLSQAIHLGATARGIRLFAEAMTGIDFDLTEEWRYGSFMSHTWADWEGISWDTLSLKTWDEMERSALATNETVRNVATLYPSHPLTDGEKYDLEQSLDRLKPAHMIILVSNERPDVDVQDIPFRASSPSQKWEIRQLIQNKRINGVLPFPDEPEDEFISPPVNPWSGYSGEAWTVLDRTPRLLAYVTPDEPSSTEMIDVRAADMPPQGLSSEPGATQTVSLPEYAIKQIQGLYSGRSASDGIVTTNPYSDRGSQSSNLLIDRMPADFAQSGISTAARTSDRFWTSPPRQYTDQTRDILELRFDEPANFNHVSFEFAVFPCVISVQYWDRSLAQWIQIGKVNSVDSIPYGFPNQPPAGTTHPFHYGEGHWSKRSFSVTPVLTQNIRFVFNRIDGNGPVGNTNDTKIAYPVGLREVDVGYRVNAASRAPHVSTLSPVATNKNVAGLQTRYFLQEASADLVEDDEMTAWICEPQPFSDAVVNMYLTVGDGTFPAIVNNLYVDPVHSGSVMNLYSTMDIPQGNALSEPKDDVLEPSVFGPVTPVLSGTRGLSFSTVDPTWIDIDAKPIGGTSSGGDLWVGLQWQFEDFPVVPAQGKFVSVFSSALPDGHINILHGLEVGTDSYTIFVVTSRGVSKLKWTGLVPPVGATVKLAVSIGGSPTAVAQIDTSAVISSNDIQQSSSFATSGTFDPQKERRPADHYADLARSHPLTLRAPLYVGGSEWNGPIAASLDEHTYFYGNLRDVNEKSIFFPGDVGNFINIPVNTPQNDLATSKLIYGMVRVQPPIWDTGSEMFFGGSLAANTNTGGGFGWGVLDNGCLVFEWDTGGTTRRAISDVPLDRRSPSPLDLCFTLDTSLLRFWYKDGLSAEWTQLGSTLNIDTISGGTAAIGTPGRAFKFGMACPGGGTRPARPFAGAISQFRLATGLTGKGSNPNTFTGTMVIDIQPANYGAVMAPNTTPTSFTSSTGDTCAMASDNLARTIVPLSILFGPCMIVPESYTGYTSSGIVVNDQVADSDFNHWLAATVVASVPFVPLTGYAPILTKKASSSATDRGWGIYLNSSGRYVILMSDGTTQTETAWTNSTVTGTSQPPNCVSVHSFLSTVRIANYQIGETVSPAYVQGDTSALLTLSNTEPVRIFADAFSTTAGMVYSVSASSSQRDADPANNFHLVSQSLAEKSFTVSIGSSWTVTSDGSLSGTPLVRGDTLFEQSGGSVDANGKTSGSASLLVKLPSTYIRYGSSVTKGPGYKLLGSTIGYGQGPGTGYLANPDGYNKIGLSNDTALNLGTFVRYHPDYFGWTNALIPSIGFMGGTPESWSQAIWTPIGQFVLSQGGFNFPDTFAKGIKMEFTDLTPEPYESFLPINRMISRMTKLTAEEQGRSQTPTQQASIDILTPNRFTETIRPFFEASTDPLLNNVSPTAGAVVIDGTLRDGLADSFGPLYGMSPWQQGFRGTINAATGTHTYDVTSVQAVTRTSFFVGLRTVRVRNIGQRGIKDNPYYWETFYDTDNVDVPKTTFEIEPGQLYTPEFRTSSVMPLPRSSQSKPYYSRSPVVGLQFATQQSQSVQILPDDEFRSPDLVSIPFTQDERWHRSGDGIVFWDQAFGTVRVSRDPAVLDSYFSPDTPIVHPPISPVLASGFARITTMVEDSSGGITSPDVSIGPRGVVWCAARVAAFGTLRADLWLRAYDTTGTLLAEKAFRPKDGFPTEVTMSFVSYRADSYGINVRVEQDGPWTDSWIMYALSAFDTGIVWEFSNDGGLSWVPGHTTRNLLHGVVEFPTPGAALLWRCTAYRYNAIVDAIEIRPWYERRIGAPL